MACQLLTAGMRKLLATPLLLALPAACEPPETTTKVDVVLDSPVVLSATPKGDAEMWYVEVEGQQVPTGEYFLFGNGTTPTSSSGLETFEPAACHNNGPGCVVSGLGTLIGSTTVNADGKLVGLLGHYNLGGGYFSVARRSGAEGESSPGPIKLTVTIIGGTDGAPRVDVSSLSH